MNGVRREIDVFPRPKKEGSAARRHGALALLAIEKLAVFVQMIPNLPSAVGVASEIVCAVEIFLLVFHRFT